jgi:hypothetical protein
MEIIGIVEIMGITEIVSKNPQSRRREDHSTALLM